MAFHKIEPLKHGLDAKLAAPPSKAHTLRALFLGSLAAGKTRIINPLLAQDQLTAIAALEKLGSKLYVSESAIEVNGTGGVLSAPKLLDARDSGLSMRCLCALATLAGKGGEKIVVDGSDRMHQRPVGELIAGLRSFGAIARCTIKDGFPPVELKGKSLQGGTAILNGNEGSQSASALLMALPLGPENSILEIASGLKSRPYLEITRDCMKEFGVEVKSNASGYSIEGGCAYSPAEFKVEGDYSSALFFAQAAAVCAGRIEVSGLQKDSSQADKKAIGLFKAMGCLVEQNDNCLSVEGPEKLTALTADMSDCPDAVPAVAVACAFAKGTSKLTGIGHLRHKESDRLDALACGIRAIGGKALVGSDASLEITGSRQLSGGQVNTHCDHRIAMAFSVAGLKISGVSIDDSDCVGKSFPAFWKVMDSLR